MQSDSRAEAHAIRKREREKEGEEEEEASGRPPLPTARVQHFVFPRSEAANLSGACVTIASVRNNSRCCAPQVHYEYVYTAGVMTLTIIARAVCPPRYLLENRHEAPEMKEVVEYEGQVKIINP